MTLAPGWFVNSSPWANTGTCHSVRIHFTQEGSSWPYFRPNSWLTAAWAALQGDFWRAYQAWSRGPTDCSSAPHPQRCEPGTQPGKPSPAWTWTFCSLQSSLGSHKWASAGNSSSAFPCAPTSHVPVQKNEAAGANKLGQHTEVLSAKALKRWLATHKV